MRQSLPLADLDAPTRAGATTITEANLMSDEQFRWPRRRRIAVVVPCYKVERHIAAVIRGMPEFVSLIVAVDDACPNGSAAAVEKVGDPRVVLIEHETNQGVGGAMLTGYWECLNRGADVIVKMDGDGQMDPRHLASLVRPIVNGGADYAKGNRWHHGASLSRMPALRRIGNLGLSFLAKLSSGHWKIFDPCNGYTAVHAGALRRIEMDRIARDYFFEISLLVELGIAEAAVRDVPMPAVYGEEISSLRVGRILRTFPHRLAKSLLRRIWRQHFVREFGPLGLFLVSGGMLLTWGAVFGACAWTRSLFSGIPATSGTVMLSAMPFLMGFQLLLQALMMDMANCPSQPLSHHDAPEVIPGHWALQPAHADAVQATDADLAI
jgi:glycosyltransferase involved in cell wall biosynthesis